MHSNAMEKDIQGSSKLYFRRIYLYKTSGENLVRKYQQTLISKTGEKKHVVIPWVCRDSMSNKVAESRQYVPAEPGDPRERKVRRLATR